MTADPVVQMTGMTVAFPGVVALDDVDLTLHAGEIHAVMGGNGAGKSSLVKALTGVYPALRGEIRIGGTVQRMTGRAESIAAGIAVAYQDSFLCGNLSIGENVMLGHEVRGRFGIDWPATHLRAAATLAELGLDDLDPRTPVSRLSIAERQLVAIGRATVTHPRVLVLDEPTSSLDETEVARLFAVMRRLRDSGVAILFISHFLEQVYAISDRMTVLRDGRHRGTFAVDEIDRSELIALMMGKDISALKAIGSERRAHQHDPSGPPLYRATGLGRQGVLAPTDLELHAGEVVGIAGLRGSGRTELARMIAGADRPDSGAVFIGEAPVTIGSPAAALRRRIAFASEERREEGVIGELSGRRNILLALQAVRGWARPIARAERDDTVDRYAEAVGLGAADLRGPVKNLSDGNQQKVLLARWLATRPRLLILDEPTRGVDVAAKVDIQSYVSGLARSGVAVVYISSELEEVVRLSDRIVVMKDRNKIGEVSNGPALNADSIVELIAADREEAE